VVRGVRGDSVGFRLILVFKSLSDAQRFSKNLRDFNVYHSFGYKFANINFETKEIIENKIIDIPIDYSQKKRNYLRKVLKKIS